MSIVKLLLFLSFVCVFTNFVTLTKETDGIVKEHSHHTLDEILGDRFNYYASVVTIPGDDDRINDFYTRWHSAWPSQTFNKHYCFKHNQKFRSLGLFACFYQILAGFINSPDFETYDYILLFEDDGIPFEGTIWPNDLDDKLDRHPNIELLLLGAHAVQGKNKKTLRGDEEIFKATDSSGTYGFLVKASSAKKLMDVFEEELKKKVNAQSGVDHFLWKPFKKNGYVSVPLLVDHRHGTSHTWENSKNAPSRKFEGHRDFWNFVD